MGVFTNGYHAPAANDAEREPPPGRFDDDEPPPFDDSEPPPPKAEGPGTAKAGPVRCAETVVDVLDEWRTTGPLVHEPTGIAELDEWTGGGPVYGTRWFLLGAPDAGKTAIELQTGHDMAKRGVTVGLLAADEEAGDLVTRLAQRVGYSRHHCEARDPVVLDQMQGELAELPIRFYDGSWTIENAAADLAAWAKERAEANPASHPNGPRAFLGIDSVQTVMCAADVHARVNGRELSEVAAVTARVHAVRTVATRYRLIALATSEMGRGAYRSSDPAQQTSALASGKWSGAIEYSGRVVLAVRSVSGEKDLIEVEVAKNKHGPRDVKTYLRIDRRSQTLTAVSYEPAPAPDRAVAKASKFQGDCQIVLACVPMAPASIGRDDLLARLSGRGASCSVNTLKTRIAKLIEDRAVVDLSDGSKQTPRQYARLSVISERDHN